MNTDLLERAIQIVEDALELDAGARQGYVQRECGADQALLNEVESILQHSSGIELAAPLSSDNVPETLFPLTPPDRYELQDEIGRGGMGVVYRARDHQLAREVALKVLRASSGGTKDALHRFLGEAHVAARLQHPGVAPIYDIGRLQDGRPFLALKLVVGKTLGDLLADREDGRNEDSQLLLVFDHLCQTIAYAHSKEIIHRDLKPNNVMVGEFGEVQVMDWGLAKDLSLDANRSSQADEAEAQSASQVSVSQSPISGGETRAGVVMGTPAYMPPEQAVGRPGKPTDVFSLGSILCEILTGTPPYTADSPAEVYEKSTKADLLEAKSRLENCPSDVELVELAKDCLQAEAEDRPADAGEVAHRFSHYLQTVQTRLRNAEITAARSEAVALEETKRRRVVFTLMATGLVLVTVVLGGWIWTAQQRAQRAAEEATRQAQVVQQLNDAKTEAVRLRQVAQDAPLDDFATLGEARAKIEHALALLETSNAPEELSREIAELARDILRLEADRKLLAQIETAREQARETTETVGNTDVSNRDRRRTQLGAVFRATPLLPGSGHLDAVAFLNEKAPGIREVLIGAIDEWMLTCDSRSEVDWLVKVTSAVDKNQWRNEWRTAVLNGGFSSLRDIGHRDEMLLQTPRSVINWYQSIIAISPNYDARSVLVGFYPRHPADLWLNCTLGDAYYGGAEADRAIQYYSVALGIRQTSNTLYRIGALHNLARRHEEALFHLEKAVTLNPRLAIGWERLAGIYFGTSRMDEAKAAFDRAFELHSGDITLKGVYADFLYDNNEKARAIEYLTKEQVPSGYNSLVLRERLVAMLIRENRFKDAAAAFREPVEMRSCPTLFRLHIMAAVAAVRAANGEGVGSAELSDEERSTLRRQAVKSLRYALEAWLARRQHTENVLSMIDLPISNGHFKSVHEPQSLQSLPPEEQDQWRGFWFNLAEAHRQLTYVDPDVSDMSRWTVLISESLESRAGAIFRRLPDGSFLVSGASEMGDTYSITTNLAPIGITAVRLDVIADDSLPGKGPGRHATGNFHLTEIGLEIPDDRLEGKSTPTPFDRAWATYSWPSRPVKNAIDGDPDTEWHVWGRLGASHTAIFYLPRPIASTDATSFTIRLAHSDEMAANLGRFRLSIQRTPAVNPDSPVPTTETAQ